MIYSDSHMEETLKVIYWPINKLTCSSQEYSKCPCVQSNKIDMNILELFWLLLVIFYWMQSQAFCTVPILLLSLVEVTVRADQLILEKEAEK